MPAMQKKTSQVTNLLGLLPIISTLTSLEVIVCASQRYERACRSTETGFLTCEITPAVLASSNFTAHQTCLH